MSNSDIRKNSRDNSSKPASISEDNIEKAGEWCDGFEIILKKEAEQSESLFWLHNKASLLATKFNDYIQIPSIVLQTVTGFLSATSGLVPSIALGGISIFTGVLTTILSYYKFSAKAEGHRVVAQLYMQIYKKIEVELLLPISQRENPQVLVKEVREKLAKISEVAPDIPESIISLYKLNFKDNTTSKPIIANGLDEIEIYKEKAKKIPIKINYLGGNSI